MLFVANRLRKFWPAVVLFVANRLRKFWPDVVLFVANGLDVRWANAEAGLAGCCSVRGQRVGLGARAPGANAAEPSMLLCCSWPTGCLGAKHVASNRLRRVIISRKP